MSTTTWAFIGSGLAVGVGVGTAINEIVGGDAIWIRILANITGGWGGMITGWVVGKQFGRMS